MLLMSGIISHETRRATGCRIFINLTWLSKLFVYELGRSSETIGPAGIMYESLLNHLLCDELGYFAWLFHEEPVLLSLSYLLLSLLHVFMYVLRFMPRCIMYVIYTFITRIMQCYNLAHNKLLSTNIQVCSPNYFFGYHLLHTKSHLPC